MTAARSVAGRLAVAILGVAVVVAVVTTPAGASDRRAGSVTIMRAGDPGSTAQSGTSEDRFALKAPPRAACPGDSLNDDYRVQSFLVPDTDNPGTLEYEALKPTGDGRWALYNTWGSRWVQKGTAPNAGPGTPGLLEEAPVLTFAYFQPGQVTAGTYRIGLACTFGTSTVRYWDARIEVVADPTVPGAQLRWNVLDQVPYSAPSGSNWLLPAFAAVVGFLLLFAGSWWLFSRSDRIAPDPSSTDETHDKELSP